MKLQSFHWPYPQALAEEYVHRFDGVKDFFEGHFSDERAYQERMEWLSRSDRLQADRQRLVTVLTAYNEQIGNSPESLHAIQRLNEPNALAVVGGQQAGLFTGPLLVIYKAVSLIRTARWAEKKLHRPVVPVFWIAGEDHDFEEVNHIYYLSSKPAVEKIRLSVTPDKRASVHRIAVPAEAWEEVLGDLEHSLAPTEFKEELMARIRELALQSRTLVDLFARMMAWMFGTYGLVLVNSDDPELRRLEVPMFERLLNEHESLGEAFRQASRSVEQKGYAPQVDLQEHSANLFLFHDGERQLLFAGDGGFHDRKSKFLFREDELHRLLRTSPSLFSNNVLTRPLMQEFLFPVLAAVLGPGEIAYWALTKDAFRFMDMRMPILVPRPGYTLLEGTVQKHMEKFGFTFAEVIGQFSEKREQWLKAQDEFRLEERFADVRARFLEMYSPLITLLETINPSLGKLGETNIRKILEQMAYLEQRAVEAQRSQHEAALRQMEKIMLTVLPLGKPQERVYNVLAYLNRYGSGWLEHLLREDVEPDGLHRIVYF